MRRGSLLLLGLPAWAAAQAPAPAVEGRATLSAAYARGNTHSERLYGDARATLNRPEARLNLDGKAERRDEPPAGTATSWLGRASYDRFVSERRFAYARGSLEHDTAKDVERRTAVGAGLGADLFAGEPFTLSVRGGPEYVTVERNLAPGEGYPALGWGARAAYKVAATRLELFHEQEGFRSLEDTRRVVLRSKSGLRVPLVDRLSGTVQLNVDWEREPAPGRRPTDSTLLVGLDYTF